ncbi:MAG: hypothetical protein JJE13_09690 [Thermoleophilia bacterium]|nr:hypothetical protein [Thermoleophilia bacterium]
MTVRYGSDVTRQSFDDLEAAISAAEAMTEKVLADGPMDSVTGFKEYPPDQLVNARIEISGKGLISPPTAGIDIQGDGGMLGFTGGVRRQPIAADDRKQIFDGIREALGDERPA